MTPPVRHAHPELQVLSAAMAWYHQTLLKTPDALAYLADGRGYADPQAVARRYHLGFAPGRGLVRQLQRMLSMDDATLLSALGDSGLLRRPKESDGAATLEASEFFFRRLIFPVCWDVGVGESKIEGAPVGFGGRVMGDGEPKYLNTRETPHFSKGALLYGLPQARAAIRANRRILLVEGYFDVIRLQTAGFAETLGILGTAFDPGVVNRVKKAVWGSPSRAPDYLDWVLCLDSDTAGDEAVAKALQRCWDAGIAPRVAQIEGGKDADEAIRAHGPDVVHAALAAATAGSRYVLPGPGRDPRDPYRTIHELIHAVRTLTEQAGRWADPTVRAGIITDFTSDLRTAGFDADPKPLGSIFTMKTP